MHLHSSVRSIASKEVTFTLHYITFILSRLEIVLPLLKVLLKHRRSDEKKWISTVPSIGPREKKIFFLLFLDEIVQQCALVTKPHGERRIINLSTTCRIESLTYLQSVVSLS